MPTNPIHFGTSGWRGIIAEDFTFENVRLAASAIAHYLLEHSTHPRVLVGYDTRFLSEKFAEAAGEILPHPEIKFTPRLPLIPRPPIPFAITKRDLKGPITSPPATTPRNT